MSVRSAAPRAARRASTVAVVAALLTVGAVACDRSDDGASRSVAAAQAPDFDGQSAQSLVERQVAFGPRAPNSPGHRDQLAWMETYLRERADTVVLQPFDYAAHNGDTLRLTNVFARFRPEAAERVLLVAHWDTRTVADMDPDSTKRDQPILGANDGASGVAVLLQLADVLSRHSPPVGVDLLFTDGEDYRTGEMYLGATHFAANPVPGPGYRPLYGILIDMIGDRNPVFPIETNSYEFAPEVVERVWRLADEIGYGHLFVRRESGAISDDHMPLNRGGIRTIDIIDLDYPYWHTTGDVLEQTSARGLEAVGTVLTTLIYRGG